jgi:outer membrane protein assembly factor BamB
MTFREPPAPSPLVTILGNALTALDASSGRLLWSQPVAELVRRVVVAERTAFVVTAPPRSSDPSRVLVFDLHTGAPRASIEAGFPIMNALARGDRAYFGGTRGVLALRADGGVLFHATPTMTSESAWSGDTYDLVMRDGAARELWRMPSAPSSVADGLLVLGDAAAQPDFNT